MINKPWGSQVRLATAHVALVIASTIVNTLNVLLHMEVKTNIPIQKNLAFCTKGKTLDIVISLLRELIVTKISQSQPLEWLKLWLGYSGRADG